MFGHTKTHPVAFPSSIDNRSELPYRFCTDRPTSEMARAFVEAMAPIQVIQIARRGTSRNPTK